MHRFTPGRRSQCRSALHSMDQHCAHCAALYGTALHTWLRRDLLDARDDDDDATEYTDLRCNNSAHQHKATACAPRERSSERRTRARNSQIAEARGTYRLPRLRWLPWLPWDDTIERWLATELATCVRASQHSRRHSEGAATSGREITSHQGAGAVGVGGAGVYRCRACALQRP